MHPPRFFRPLLSSALALCLLCIPLAGQEEPAAAALGKQAAMPRVSVEAVRLEPANPGPAALTKLFITLENHGEQTASLFAFAVEVGGESLEVYEDELYVLSLAAGARQEVRLFNFWTSESGRPMPKDGKLKVEVRLEAAKWVKIERREEGEETWTPLGEVEGLPSTAGLSAQLLAKTGTGG